MKPGPLAPEFLHKFLHRPIATFLPNEAES